MCNHYQNNPEAIPTWKEYIGAAGDTPFAEIKIDVWPKYQGVVARIDGGQKILDTMQWGVPLTMKGKRPGTTVTKRITNVRNLSSPFWRSMLTKAENRCLVPFTKFAGIWRPSDEGNVFAFLTCEPNPLIKPIHPKAMPVILQPEDYGGWLSGEDAEKFAVPFPSQLMSIAA